MLSHILVSDLFVWRVFRTKCPLFHIPHLVPRGSQIFETRGVFLPELVKNLPISALARLSRFLYFSPVGYMLEGDSQRCWVSCTQNIIPDNVEGVDDVAGEGLVACITVEMLPDNLLNKDQSWEYRENEVRLTRL
jgi:hypothetical protein